MNEVRRRIAWYVIKQYKITNPEIISLSRYTVGEILTGVPWQSNRKNTFINRVAEEMKFLWLQWTAPKSKI